MILVTDEFETEILMYPFLFSLAFKVSERSNAIIYFTKTTPFSANMEPVSLPSGSSVAYILSTVAGTLPLLIFSLNA